MPAAATAATSGEPYRAYGPTVDTTTRVDSARSRIASVSAASATITGTSAPVSIATWFSLPRLRPAIAHATSPSVPTRSTSRRHRICPTKLVAPNTTRSYSRSLIVPASHVTASGTE